MSRVVTEYEVRSAADELLYTSPHRDLALREARRLKPNNPGVWVDEVERIERRHRVWTDRASLRPAPSPTYPHQQGAMQ